MTEKLSDFANYHLQAREAIKKQVQGKSLSVPLNNNNSSNVPTSNSDNFLRKQSLCRTTSIAPNSQQQHLVPPTLQLAPHKQYRLSPGQQALSASSSPTNNVMPHMHQHQQQHFPKSHSIDNLPREMYQPMNYGNNNLWNQGQQPELSNQHGQIDSQDMSINLHKKLQRQLSLLNPFDPRIYPIHRFPNAHMGQSNPNADHFQLSPPAHKPLSTSHSTGNALGQNLNQSMYEHQVRINWLLIVNHC